jgi:hypothetical protein
MSDLLFQQLSSVQSNLQPTPPTIASAATISPTTKLTFLTGTAQVATINPPVSGYHELVLIFTNANPGATVTTGNIKTAVTPIQNIPLVLYYDPVTALYWSTNILS